MQLITSGYDLFIARNIYHQFSRKPGSHRIASAFSLCHLSRLIRLRKPRTVLEIGAGIGTISQLVLLHQERVENLYSIEQNPFCCAALKENVTPLPGQSWRLLPSQDAIPRDLAFDLIVFDGNQYEQSTLGFLSAETAVFVDGMRRRTRDELESYCDEVGLSLRLHEYAGGWRLGLSRHNDRRVAHGIFFKRERCHLGVCKAPVAVPATGYRRHDPAFEAPGVETA
jgi:hypothetical protein